MLGGIYTYYFDVFVVFDFGPIPSGYYYHLQIAQNALDFSILCNYGNLLKMKLLIKKGKNSVKWMAVTLCVVCSGTAAAAVIHSDSFDSSPTLANTQAAGAYYTDRYAPSVFNSQSFLGDNRLALELSVADGGDNRPSGYSGSFYNTQGRKYDVAGTTFASIDMFVDSVFITDPNRVGGLWGTAVDASNAITAFPILEFANGAFQIWNGAGFDVVGLPTSFAPDTFVNLAFELDSITDSFKYYLNNELVFTDTTADGSISLSNLIIQGYNTQNGIDRTLYFDNLVAKVPEPSTLLLFFSSLVAVFVSSRRRHQAS